MYVKLGPVGRKNRAETVVIDDYDVWKILRRIVGLDLKSQFVTSSIKSRHWSVPLVRRIHN